MTVVERSVDAGFDVAHQLATHPALHLPGNQLAVPQLTQFIRRNRDRPQAGGRLAGEEAEGALEFGRDQRAQRHVVEQDKQAHVLGCLVGRHAQRHVAGHRGDFRLEVDPQVLAGKADRVVPGHEAVGDALVHQRCVENVVRKAVATGGTVAADVAEVAGTVEVLVAARQRCRQAVQVQGEGPGALALVESAVQLLQMGLDLLPVVQCCLHGRRDGARFHGAAQVAADHQKHAVAAGFS
ncbi:hypothetical protein D3C85_1271670 [compost metagenome]